MTWSDPTVDEIRRIKDDYAAKFHYDLQAIFRDLKEQEARSGRQIISVEASKQERRQSAPLRLPIAHSETEPMKNECR